MPEFFVHAASFAAPFFSDESTGYQEGNTAVHALERYAASYKHPAGLYAADAYTSADAYHKGEERLARWLSNKARELEARTANGTHSIYSHGPDTVEIR